jgi:hypothetical protein
MNVGYPDRPIAGRNFIKLNRLIGLHGPQACVCQLTPR